MVWPIKILCGGSSKFKAPNGVSNYLGMRRERAALLGAVILALVLPSSSLACALWGIAFPSLRLCSNTFWNVRISHRHTVAHGFRCTNMFTVPRPASAQARQVEVEYRRLSFEFQILFFLWVNVSCAKHESHACDWSAAQAALSCCPQCLIQSLSVSTPGAFIRLLCFFLHCYCYYYCYCWI